MSPLYPVLQPGLVCQYDLQLPQDISADISIEIADLSLDPAQSSPSGHHCVSSFLHILGGTTFLDLKSVTTLCGLVHYPSNLSHYKISVSSVRLLMVAGSSSMIDERRGFLVNVFVSPSRMKIPLHKIIFLLAFFGVLVLILAVLASVIIYHNRKSKVRRSLPRRRQTWHGSVPMTGESVHQNRTERIRQWGTDNLYMFDNSVTRRGLPELPAFNFASEEHSLEADVDNSGFKVYESLSHLEFNLSEKTSLPSPSPPSLPQRPTPTIEDCYSSPLYLTLTQPGDYSDTCSQAGQNVDGRAGEDGAQVVADGEDVAQVVADGDTGRKTCGRQRSSLQEVIMNRIRSISMTECGEDETTLLDVRGEDEQAL